MENGFTIRYIDDLTIHELPLDAPTTDIRYAFAEAMARLYMRNLTQVYWSVWQGERFVAAFNRRGFAMTRGHWQQVADAVTTPNSEEHNEQH